MKPVWKFDEEGWQADVAAILAEQRAKCAPRPWDRAAMLQSVEDHDDPQGDRIAQQRGK